MTHERQGETTLLSPVGKTMSPPRTKTPDSVTVVLPMRTRCNEMDIPSVLTSAKCPSRTSW